MRTLLLAALLLATPAFAQDEIHLEPDLTFTMTGQVHQYFRVGGTVENQAPTAPLPFAYGLFPFVANYRTFSETDGVEPLFQDAFFDWTTVEQRAGYGETGEYMPVSLLSKPSFEAWDGAALYFPSHSALWSQPTYRTRGTGVLGASRLAIDVQDAIVKGTGVTIPENTALYVAPLTAGEENYSIHSVGTQAMVHEGPVAVGLTANATREYLRIDTEAGAPPAADCDSATEVGRMVANDTTAKLYVCFSVGWRAK